MTTRATVLQAAEEMFSARGYQATSLRSLAASIGMTHAGILHHYRTKEELLADVLERMEDSHDALYDRINHMPFPARDRVQAIATQSILAPKVAELYTVLLGEATIRTHPARERIAARFEKVSRFLQKDFGDAASDIFSAWDGLQLIWLYLPGRFDLPETLSKYIGERLRPYDGRRASEEAPNLTHYPSQSGLPVSDRQDSKKDRIVIAAASAFARNGYRATSLRHIAADMETSHGSLLYYFQSKEALLEAVLTARDRVPARFLEKPKTAIDAIYKHYRLAIYNETIPELVDLYSVLVCEATDPVHPAHEYFAHRFERVIDGLRQDIQRLVDSGGSAPHVDPAFAAIITVALWDGWQLHSSYSPAIKTPERLLAHLNSIVAHHLPELTT